MKIIENTLELVVDTWDDPGDYPSNAGQSPLASYQYVSGCDGELTLDLSASEYSRLKRAIEEDGMQDFINDLLDNTNICNGISHVIKWYYTVRGTLLRPNIVLWINDKDDIVLD